MFEIKSISRLVKETDMTREEARHFDRVNHMRRLSGAEMEGVMMAVAASYLLDVAATRLGELARDKGIGWMKAAVGMVNKLARLLSTDISVEQKKIMHDNLAGTVVNFTAMEKPGYMNVNGDRLKIICDEVVDGKCAFCIRTVKEARKCPLRAALDGVPGCKERRGGKDFLGGCPYQGAGMDADILTDSLEADDV